MKQRFSTSFFLILAAIVMVAGGVLASTVPMADAAGSRSTLLERIKARRASGKFVRRTRRSIRSQKQTLSVTDLLKGQDQLKKFRNMDELKEFLEERSGSGNYYGYPSVRTFAVEELAVDTFALEEIADAAPSAGTGRSLNRIPAPSITPPKALPPADGPGSTDYSKTNVQEEGVDEPDIVKTDGKYIYTLANQNLFIVDANPAKDAEVLAKIAFKDRPQDMFIHGDSLIVFGHDNQIHRSDLLKSIRRPYSQYTFFKVFDISDRRNPVQKRDLNLEGNYKDARMIGDYVYFVTTNYARYIADPVPLPIMFENGARIVPDPNTDVYYFDIPGSSFNFTNVAAINVAQHDKKITNEVYLLEQNQNMYVSPHNMYITYTKHLPEGLLELEVLRELVYPKLSSRDQYRVRAIEAVESFILSREEKLRKIGYILERYQSTLTDEEEDKLQEDLERAIKAKFEDIAAELEKTVIHKIAIRRGALEYVASGSVTGHVLNQFSMSEAGEYFRIATTKNRSWSQYVDEEDQESYSNVFVLDKNLKKVGSVEKLAKGERIYSVRFMQNRAYMVTFKQIDPLFVIDLTVPTQPRVLGELKIPGFSTYLHPYDDTRLMGLGRDTEETEWGGVRQKGVKLSMFDVSDVRNPKEIDTYVFSEGYSDSVALHEHKAFLFSKEKNLLAIPVRINQPASRGIGRFSFGGAAVFTVNEHGFELKGKIDHADSKEGKREYGHYYDNSVKRSLYIDDTLYTVSSKYIKMNAIEDLAAVNTLALKKTRTGNDDDFDIVN